MFYTDGHRKRLHNLNRLVGWIEGNGGKNLQCHSSEGAGGAAYPFFELAAEGAFVFKAAGICYLTDGHTRVGKVIFCRSDAGG